MENVWDALYTGTGLFWRALWALALGYAISAFIQVFLSRQEAARYLGEARPRQLALSMGLGFASSSPPWLGSSSAGSLSLLCLWGLPFSLL